MSTVSQTVDRKIINQATTSKTPRPAQAKQTLESRTDLGPLNLDQELEHFCSWSSKPIWVPPKDTSTELAKTMLGKYGAFASKEECWKGVFRSHRSDFTQVREIELPRSSIRLPKGRLFVSVTEQKNFDTIEEEVPNCVRTRLDEFLEGPNNKRGTKVYYLKPLCVEVDSQLVFTTQEELDSAISQIQEEVFSAYRRMYLLDRIRRGSIATFNAALAIPRSLIQSAFNRKKQEIEHYHRQMEFQRKKLTLDALEKRKEIRTDRCHYDDLLALTHTPSRERVIEKYCEQNNKSDLDRHMFMIMSAASLPWFVGLSLAAYNLVTVSMTASATMAMVDPVFVAELPNRRGELMKIGHFDEVDGVMHVEI